MRPAAFVEFWCICLDPAPNATGIHFHTPFLHDFRDMLVGQRIPEIPTDAQQDELTRIVRPLKGFVARIGMSFLS